MTSTANGRTWEQQQRDIQDEKRAEGLIEPRQITVETAWDAHSGSWRGVVHITGSQVSPEFLTLLHKTIFDWDNRSAPASEPTSEPEPTSEDEKRDQEFRERVDRACGDPAFAKKVVELLASEANQMESWDRVRFVLIYAHSKKVTMLAQSKNEFISLGRVYDNKNAPLAFLDWKV